MPKVRELCGLIHSKYDTEAQLARELGWNRQKLNKITTGTKEPDLTEASMLANALGVSLEQVADIFLRKMSPNEQQRTA